MHMSKQALDTLIDLVENKLSCMDVWDREDRREHMLLQRSLRELQVMRGSEQGAKVDLVAAEASRRGRRPKLGSLAMA